MQIAELEYALDDSILTQRTLRLRIGAGDVGLYCDRVARKLQDDAVVPGFRKGKAPLSRVMTHLWDRISAEAFDDLKRTALDQVLEKLDAKDKPFTPPDVEDREKLEMKYGEKLEFALKYLVDPAQIGQHPEQPEQGSVIPGSRVSHPANQPMGIPLGPQLPGMPTAPSAGPALPGMLGGGEDG